MRKIDVEDFDISIGPISGLSTHDGTATYNNFKVFFTIWDDERGPFVKFINPNIFKVVGITEEEMEKEILEVYDRGR